MRKRSKNFCLLLLTLGFTFQCQNSSHNKGLSAKGIALVPDSLNMYYTSLFYRLDTFFKNKQRFGAFNGTVLLSKGSRVYYQGAFGYENIITKDTLSSLSSFQIASTSKTFTATATLYLVDKGLLSLDDTIGKFIPNFPYRKIRIKDLLCHRSGLPNYLYFGQTLWKDKSKFMLNDDLIALMQKYPRLEGTYYPNRRFEYCNTNYAVLATIIERVTNKRFPVFMKETFFDPLEMNHTWVHDVQDESIKKNAISYNRKWVPAKEDPYDGVYGDKGIYSCTSDLLKWNLAFYSGKLISDAMQKEAYSPHSFEKGGMRNYGYGWRLMQQPNNTSLVYHNGWWHGNTTVFYRYIPDTFALVILSNVYNKSVYNVQPIFDIINGDKTTPGHSSGEVEE